MQAITDRQDAIDQVRFFASRSDHLTNVVEKSQALAAALRAMTTMVQNQTEDLEQASLTVTKIQQDLEKSAEHAKSWAYSTNSGGSSLDWALRIGGPVAGVMVGGYGIAARTAIQNAQLMFSGEFNYLKS